MAQNGEQVNPSNHKIHSYDQTIKIIFNLGSKNCKNNNNSTCQLIRQHNSLLMSIIKTPEKDVSNVDFGNQT